MRYRKVFLVALLAGLLFLPGCNWLFNQGEDQPSEAPSHETSYGTGVTDSCGQVIVHVEDKRIHVTVKDENGFSVPKATVKAYALEKGVLIFAGSEDHFPGIKILTSADFSPASSSPLSHVEPQLAVTTIMVISAGTGLTFYDYYKNPGEFPIQAHELIAGDRKVVVTCSRAYGNDVLSIGSALVSGSFLYRGVLVRGKPAEIRGVTALRYAMTRRTAKVTELELVAKEFIKMVGILDSNFIIICKYKTERGHEELPLVIFDVFPQPPKGPPPNCRPAS